MRQFKTTLALAATLAVAAQSQALDFDFSGAFTKDNDVVRLGFSVGADSTITIFSSSWVAGGFDPILAIWDSNGNRMSEQDDGGVVGATLSNGVLYNHSSWDSYYSVFLDEGDYIATIAQYNNFSKTTDLSDGFIHDGAAGDHFTTAFGSQPNFNGVLSSNDPRTGDWAFHILNVESAVVTPPTNVPDAGSTAGLLALAMAGFGLLRRKLAK